MCMSTCYTYILYLSIYLSLSIYIYIYTYMIWLAPQLSRQPISAAVQMSSHAVCHDTCKVVCMNISVYRSYVPYII